ncbi:hypothetical protein [uncultured Cohaesibacter sp.]|uniref:hypothetical protein n=1 Tax=uncultured Cohaesibacter sp. TaxID=1002546 RepID=UPI0029C76AE0|nr:hypothetical protein [uncultured Cohaesibacter sp.]
MDLILEGKRHDATGREPDIKPVERIKGHPKDVTLITDRPQWDCTAHVCLTAVNASRTDSTKESEQNAQRHASGIASSPSSLYPLNRLARWNRGLTLKKEKPE